MSWIYLAIAYAILPLSYIALCLRLFIYGADRSSFLAHFVLFGTAEGWFLALGYYPSSFSTACFLLLLTVAPLACFLSSRVLRRKEKPHPYDSAAIRAGSIYVRLLAIVLPCAAIFFTGDLIKRSPASVRNAGAGTSQSGTWEDDPRNWQRAFGQEKPPDVRIVRSRYTRTPHFTQESEYFFELAPDTELAKAMSDPESNVAIPPAERDTHFELGAALHEKPSWFAPRPLEAYDIYQARPPRVNCFLLIDRTTCAIFLTASIGM